MFLKKLVAANIFRVQIKQCSAINAHEAMKNWSQEPSVRDEPLVVEAALAMKGILCKIQKVMLHFLKGRITSFRIYVILFPENFLCDSPPTMSAPPFTDIILLIIGAKT